MQLFLKLWTSELKHYLIKAEVKISIYNGTQL